MLAGEESVRASLGAGALAGLEGGNSCCHLGVVGMEHLMSVCLCRTDTGMGLTFPKSEKAWCLSRKC